MSEPAPRDASAEHFPRVPGYAWAWLQRSRPVLAELAHRLTGEPPRMGFVDRLAEQFPVDPFVRDVVIDVIAEVAFNGRVPRTRPPGASWDRGLLWWAATLAGTTPDEFERRSRPTAGAQPELFETAESIPEARGTGVAQARRPAERRAVARVLRELLAAADGDQIPVSTVRALLAQVEEPPEAG